MLCIVLKYNYNKIKILKFFYKTKQKLHHIFDVFLYEKQFLLHSSPLFLLRIPHDLSLCPFKYL